MATLEIALVWNPSKSESLTPSPCFGIECRLYLVTWQINHILGIKQQEESKMPDVVIKVKANSVSRKRVEVTAGKFTMNVDEPERLGGTDTGPNPLEYLLAALAGCLNVLGHAVAREMGFAIDSMSVSIEGNLDPVAFTGRKPGVRPGYQEIRVHFKLKTSATQDLLSGWAEAIEARCPVSDNLINPTPMKITFEI